MRSFKMNEFEHLKDNLYDLWSQMESDKIDLEYSVDALCSLARYYEKMGGDYKRREKLNKEFKNE
tara:strand:- start:511 stop:705 length:195 start_codon:yes stop_codon:yes gene_type:complete